MQKNRGDSIADVVTEYARTGLLLAAGYEKNSIFASR